VAEIIQRTRPDVLLINEFDFVEDNVAVDLFRDNYLEVGQNGAEPIEYRYSFVAESNTGIPSGLDLNNDGTIGGPDDAFGFGFFPGQFGMVVYSRYPILEEQVRTFRKFLWKDMLGALLPDDPATPEPADWFSDALNVANLTVPRSADRPRSFSGPADAGEVRTETLNASAAARASGRSRRDRAMVRLRDGWWAGAAQSSDLRTDSDRPLDRR
ncbi:MAG TPA: endonuclease/exonuclease/phosphatase family protein, partial [Nocardioidaceae bacterium]|nr:endonuclease/exonuclease/phosphatase family protein [Nocardioidaceae bacterium]